LINFTKLKQRIIIENTKNKPVALQLKKLWEYRALISVFTIRDIKVQYTQTRLGIVWSFVQAISAGLIANFFFGSLGGFTSGDLPYLVFAYPGIIAWYYFSYIVTYSGTSLMQSQHLIKKVFFPKLILPFYKSLVGLVEFASWFIVYAGIVIYYSHSFTINILALPLAILCNMIVGLSVAIWLSAITIRYRDALLIIPFLIGFGILLTPVFFDSIMIPSQYHFFIYLNPMAGVIALYRWILLGSEFSIYYLFGLIPTLFVFVGGLFYFRRVEAIMADVI
jgi:lipopolysaccharide transport system permease protein